MSFDSSRLVAAAFYCLVALSCQAKDDLFDLAAIRNPETLEVKIVQDWQPVAKIPGIRQKLIEITVCEWWPGQPVRIPVTLLAPTEGTPCCHIIVANMGLTLKPALPSGTVLKMLTEHRVGVVLAGMSTIDAMRPVGELHVGMKKHLLQTKDPKFTPAWIWGMSDMRALTAALIETDVFLPEKVLATGGSKRGVGAAVCGIHDDRFTAILPVVAPIHGNPGGAYVRGSANQEIDETNQAFLDELAPGPNPLNLPDTTRRALEERDQRRADQAISIEEAKAASWTKAEMLAMNDTAWDACRMTRHLDTARARGLEFFYHVGTNDNVSPDLRQVGEQHPDFPLFIQPGGQHGGPKGSGFTLQTPSQPEADENLFAFCMHHFFEARPMVQPPTITHHLEEGQLTITAAFPEGSQIKDSRLYWCRSVHPSYTLAKEYDQWESVPMSRSDSTHFTATLPFGDSVDVVTLHTDVAGGIPFHLSSPYLSLKKTDQ